jgi:hypothetical protein
LNDLKSVVCQKILEAVHEAEETAKLNRTEFVTMEVMDELRKDMNERATLSRQAFKSKE